MTGSTWHLSEDGATLGQAGSEEGIVVRDEEHSLGARITLEREASIAPFAITCGIYGCMMHTRFFLLESEATSQYDDMKIALAVLLLTEVEGGPEGCRTFTDSLTAFVETYP